MAEAFRAAAEEGENDQLLMSKLTTTFILDPFQLNYGRQLKRYGGSSILLQVSNYILLPSLHQILNTLVPSGAKI